MNSGLKEWLNQEEPPGDFYQLVGEPRLCRDRGRLLNSFEEASEYLFQFQNHKDPKIRLRARNYQRQIADARRTVSDEARWRQYDQNLIAQILADYHNNPNFNGPSLNLDNLRRWLAFAQKVDQPRVEEVVRILTTTPKPSTSSRETQSVQAVTPTEVHSPVRPSESPNPPSSEGPRSGEIRGETSSTPGSGEPEVPRSRPEPPPPPSSSTAGAPPPPRRPHAPDRSSSHSIPQQPAPTMGRPSGNSNSNTMIWVIVAAIGAAFVVGLFGLIIAWASGAFDGRRRSRSELPHQDGKMVCVLQTKETTHSIGCRTLTNQNHRPELHGLKGFTFPKGQVEGNHCG